MLKVFKTTLKIVRILRILNFKLLKISAFRSGLIGIRV